MNLLKKLLYETLRGGLPRSALHHQPMDKDTFLRELSRIDCTCLSVSAEETYANEEQWCCKRAGTVPCERTEGEDQTVMAPVKISCSHDAWASAVTGTALVRPRNIMPRIVASRSISTISRSRRNSAGKVREEAEGAMRAKVRTRTRAHVHELRTIQQRVWIQEPWMGAGCQLKQRVECVHHSRGKTRSRLAFQPDGFWRSWARRQLFKSSPIVSFGIKRP